MEKTIDDWSLNIRELKMLTNFFLFLFLTPKGEKKNF